MSARDNVRISNAHHIILTKVECKSLYTVSCTLMPHLVLAYLASTNAGNGLIF
jgi:hypothetical protein